MPLALMIIVLSLIAGFIEVWLARGDWLPARTCRRSQSHRAGNLDNPLQVRGEDEVAQLRRAFEQMRIGLQARLEEINRLLLVSQGVASSLEMQDAVNPASVEAILSTGANSVRVVLSPSILPDTFIELPSRFTVGAVKDAYAHLMIRSSIWRRATKRSCCPTLPARAS